MSRDTANDFSLIGRFEIFESNIHDTRLMHEQWLWAQCTKSLHEWCNGR